MGQFQVEAVPQESVRMLQQGIPLGPEICLALLAIAVAPVTEELLFRGILYPFIKQQGYPNLALWGTSVLFGLLHLNLMAFLPLTFLGLVLAWLYETTDNLMAPILAHSFFNLANFLQAVFENRGLDWTVVGVGTLAAGTMLGKRFEELGTVGPEEWGSLFGPFDEEGEPIPYDELPLVIAVRNGRPAHADFEISSVDGARQRVEASAFPILTPHGSQGAIAIFWPAAASNGTGR